MKKGTGFSKADSFRRSVMAYQPKSYRASFITLLVEERREEKGGVDASLLQELIITTIL
jgi:hypothetical protein